MERLARPPRVRERDTVAVVAPSFGAAGAWPYRAERGAAYLESLGLKVRLMPTAARNDGRDVVARWTEPSGLPVLGNVEAGRTDPMVTIPPGVQAELDAGRKRLRLLESPTA